MSPSGDETETAAATEPGTDEGPSDEGPSDEGPSDDGPSPACVPGQQVSCACLGGGNDGVQVCNDEGSGYGECECPDPTGSPTSDDPDTDGETTDGETTDGETTESPAECGDGTCDAEESMESCCSDCGCAEGSSCVEDACVVDPFCGDAECNGAETQDDCCADCGCAEGSSCVEDACEVDPYCGDAACNGAETIDDCCTDCGCGDDGFVCESNACECADAYFHFENVLPDADQFCFATGSFYTQQSTAYYNNNAGSGWIYLDAAAFVDFTGEIGDTYNGSQQCCLIDTCMGNLTCPTPFGNYPCLCENVEALDATLTTCGENFFAVCG